MGIDFDLETMDRQRGLGLPEPWFRGDESFGSGRHIRDALWNDSAPPWPPIPDPTEAGVLWAAGRTLTLDEAVDEALAASIKATPAIDDRHGLTPREVEVLQLLVGGRTNVEMANILFISERTVATHVAHVYDKLDVSSRAEATAWAVRNGLA
jgi:DNA-binding CsgD family transcriptional regulator